MATLKRFWNKVFHLYGSRQLPEGLRLGEPYLLLGASEPLAPAIVEWAASLKLRMNGDYKEYENLCQLATDMRRWVSEQSYYPEMLGGGK